MKIFLPLAFLLLLSACKKNDNNNCLGDALLADVVFNGTLTIVAGVPFDLPIVHEFVGCMPLTAKFSSKVDIFQDSVLVQSIVLEVNFENEYQVTDTFTVVMNEPGSLSVKICADIYNEVQVRDETTCE